jgi:hypothetical protein
LTSRAPLAQLIGVEFVDLDPVLAPQFPGEAILLQAFGGAIDIEMPVTVDEILGACGADERLHGSRVGPTSGRNARAGIVTETG